MILKLNRRCDEVTSIKRRLCIHQKCFNLDCLVRNVVFEYEFDCYPFSRGNLNTMNGIFIEAIITRQVNIINFVALRLNCNLLKNQIIIAKHKDLLFFPFFFFFSPSIKLNWRGETERFAIGFCSVFEMFVAHHKWMKFSLKKGWKCGQVSILRIEFK